MRGTAHRQHAHRAPHRAAQPGACRPQQPGLQRLGVPRRCLDGAPRLIFGQAACHPIHPQQRLNQIGQAHRCRPWWRGFAVAVPLTPSDQQMPPLAIRGKRRHTHLGRDCEQPGVGSSGPLAADIKCRAVGQPVTEGAPTDAIGGFQHHHVGDSRLHQPVRCHQPRQPGPDDRHVILCGSRPRNVGSHRFRLLGNLLAEEVADVLDRLLSLGQRRRRNSASDGSSPARLQV